MSKITFLGFSTCAIFLLFYFFEFKYGLINNYLLNKKIYDVEVINLKYLSKQKVLDSIQIKKNQSFWLFNSTKLSNQLSKINEIQKFKFELSPSGVLKIIIKEKKPFVIWNDNGVYTFLDENGKTLNYHNSFSNILTVHGTNLKENFITLREIIEGKESFLPHKLDYIHLQKDLSWKLVFKDLKCIIFPFEEIYSYKNLIIKLQKMKLMEIYNRIDFRIKGRIHLSEEKCLV
tara:strand:+ start:90 stop:785 length:696 start_codon:yes stop_codon:yes gene_type:complete